MLVLYESFAMIYAMIYRGLYLFAAKLAGAYFGSVILIGMRAD